MINGKLWAEQRNKPKYTVTEQRGGVYSPHSCNNLKDIQSVISYLLANTEPGRSINVTIQKNK